MTETKELLTKGSRYSIVHVTSIKEHDSSKGCDGYLWTVWLAGAYGSFRVDVDLVYNNRIEVSLWNPRGGYVSAFWAKIAQLPVDYPGYDADVESVLPVVRAAVEKAEELLT